MTKASILIVILVIFTSIASTLPKKTIPTLPVFKGFKTKVVRNNLYDVDTKINKNPIIHSPRIQLRHQASSRSSAGYVNKPHRKLVRTNHHDRHNKSSRRTRTHRRFKNKVVPRESKSQTKYLADKPYHHTLPLKPAGDYLPRSSLKRVLDQHRYLSNSRVKPVGRTNNIREHSHLNAERLQASKTKSGPWNSPKSYAHSSITKSADYASFKSKPIAFQSGTEPKDSSKTFNKNHPVQYGVIIGGPIEFDQGLYISDARIVTRVYKPPGNPHRAVIYGASVFD